MKKIFLVLLVLSLGGCTGWSNFYGTVTGASVSPVSVYVARNAFDVAEATATNYLTQPKCKPAGPTICRSPAATKQIIPAVRAGRKARDDLKAFAAANPGALGPTGLYNALVAATGTLQSIYQTYNIGAIQ